MKDFCNIFYTNFNKIRYSEGQKILVEIDKIIPANKDWNDTIQRYNDVFDKIENNENCNNSNWWKHEQKNDVKNIKKRFKKLKNIYKSIKKYGYKYENKNHIKLIDIRNLTKKNIENSRLSKYYYRINGMKRLLICNYLGINYIPVKVFKVKI